MVRGAVAVFLPGERRIERRRAEKNGEGKEDADPHALLEVGWL